MINIERERWVIVLDESKIFCGLARNFNFKDLKNINETAIKTYRSEKQARAGFMSSWRNSEELIDNGIIKFVKVLETIKG